MSSVWRAAFGAILGAIESVASLDGTPSLLSSVRLWLLQLSDHSRLLLLLKKEDTIEMMLQQAARAVTAAAVMKRRKRKGKESTNQPAANGTKRENGTEEVARTRLHDGDEKHRKRRGRNAQGTTKQTCCFRLLHLIHDIVSFI